MKRWVKTESYQGPDRRGRWRRLRQWALDSLPLYIALAITVLAFQIASSAGDNAERSTQIARNSERIVAETTRVQDGLVAVVRDNCRLQNGVRAELWTRALRPGAEPISPAQLRLSLPLIDCKRAPDSRTTALPAGADQALVCRYLRRADRIAEARRVCG